MSSLVYVGEVTDPSTGLARSTFTDHPGEVMTWLCDGYRYRFNQERSGVASQCSLGIRLRRHRLMV